jgi:hypothetical protein
VLGAQALERCDDFLLIHLHRVGDHTRGLFEADASIAVSAAHARKNVEIFFLIRHLIFLDCYIEVTMSRLKTRPFVP